MKKISIENFRGFRNFEMSFTPGVTLLVGNNASGKTSLLKAVKFALSSFFSGFSDDNTRWQSPSNEDFRRVIRADWSAPIHPILIGFSLRNDMFGEANLCGIGDKELFVRKNSPKNSRNLISGLIPLRNLGQFLSRNMYDKENGESIRRYPLPLFDSISTVYTHVDKKVNKNRFLSLAPQPSLGYLECLTGGGLAAHWWKRISVLAETNKRTWEIEGVQNAIERALGPNGCNIIKGIRPIVSLNEIFIDTIDGNTTTYDLLPDGYRRLIDIVINLAFRSLLLNGELYDKEAPLHTKGVVLIDEIDLHLHPSLQATVIQGLRSAFPNIQFILTTHAPRVMSGLENSADNQVVLMRKEGENGDVTAIKFHTFGLDVNSILSLLGLSIRDNKTQKELEELFQLIDDGEEENAREMIADLRKRFGEYLPDITEAETLLNISSI